MKPEPIPGLPEELPEGERILWRGAPDWKALALHVFHVRAVAIYFAALIAWSIVTGVSSGASAQAIAADALPNVPMATVGLGLLCLLAWLIARSTIYTITSDRVVIRAGVALPKAINLPFSKIGSADVKLRKSGNGDIALETIGSGRIAYLHLWPHARPWKLAKAQPMLRGVRDAAACAHVLATALADKAGQPAPRLELETGSQPTRAPEPAHDIVPAHAAAAGSSA